jgi:Tfp pilus assembly protein PilO
MTLFWTIIIISAAVVGLGWIVYLVWDWRQNKLEKQMPKQRSERYKQATSSVADYAKKLAEFKKPTYKQEGSPPTDKDRPQ